MAETTVRLERPQGFTVVTNDILRDTTLSLKTKGLFAILASLPPNWEYSIAGLAKTAGVGKDAIKSSLTELEKGGYLTREQTHDENGRFASCSYVIHEKQSVQKWPLAEKPLAVKPLTEKPLAENPPQYNKDLIKETSINTPQSPPEGGRADISLPKHKPERFAGFWAFYPKHVKRERAVRAWDRIKPSDELIDAMGRALKTQVAYWQAQNTDPRYIPHASTWLNGREWENDPQVYSLRHQTTTTWLEDPEVM